jgi:hypothetical protein
MAANCRSLELISAPVLQPAEQPLAIVDCAQADAMLNCPSPSSRRRSGPAGEDWLHPHLSVSDILRARPFRVPLAIPGEKDRPGADIPLRDFHGLARQPTLTSAARPGLPRSATRIHRKRMRWHLPICRRRQSRQGRAGAWLA